MVVPTQPVLALVVPCYNEVEIIDNSCRHLTSLVDTLITSKEIAPTSFICFVDDGSRDQTWVKLTRLAKRYPSVQALKLARNVGHQSALVAGLLTVYQSCDCAISIDADLQQDITAIPKFLAAYRRGAAIVFGVRQDRSTDSWSKRFTAVSFYKIMSWLGAAVLKNHADYRLVSRPALEAFSQYNESALFLRGIFANLGFQTAVVHFEVKERTAGQSKYSWRKMFQLAFDGITSFSVKPLRLVSLVGFIVFLTSLLMTVSLLAYALLTHRVVPGWTSIVLPIYFLGGIQLLCLGVVGEYLGKIYQETKSRPRYIIEERIG